MSDAPATKKDIAELQKQVDKLEKWFQDEKKVVHDQIDQGDKRVTAEINTIQKWVTDELNKLGTWVEDELKKLHK
jgi:hypothetical protein